MDEEPIDWAGCVLVERIPGKLSGTPLIVGSRVRPRDLLANRTEGDAWLADGYDLPIETVRTVLAFHDARVKGAFAPAL